MVSINMHSIYVIIEHECLILSCEGTNVYFKEESILCLFFDVSKMCPFESAQAECSTVSHNRLVSLIAMELILEQLLLQPYFIFFFF